MRPRPRPHGSADARQADQTRRTEARSAALAGRRHSRAAWRLKKSRRCLCRRSADTFAQVLAQRRHGASFRQLDRVEKVDALAHLSSLFVRHAQLVSRPLSPPLACPRLGHRAGGVAKASPPSVAGATAALPRTQSIRCTRTSASRGGAAPPRSWRWSAATASPRARCGGSRAPMPPRRWPGGREGTRVLTACRVGGRQGRSAQPDGGRSSPAVELRA
jgi:hypothetical protein